MSIPVERIIVCLIIYRSPDTVIQTDIICLSPVLFIFYTSDITGFEIPVVCKQFTECGRQIIIMFVLIGEHIIFLQDISSARLFILILIILIVTKIIVIECHT